MAVKRFVYAALQLPLILALASFGSAQELGCMLQVGDPEVYRITQLQGIIQITALRSLLANRRDSTEGVFHYGNRLRAALRDLVRDADVGEAAARELALLAVPGRTGRLAGRP